MQGWQGSVGRKFPEKGLAGRVQKRGEGRKRTGTDIRKHR
jgi:hypothetical protein